jgi:branched-chain amino acid transport system substrate-binding protein
MSWHRLTATGLALCALAFTAGCGKEESGDAVKGGTIKLGAALSLTGQLAREGELTKQGYEFCASRINEKGGVKVGDKSYKIAVTYRDDKSEPDTAGQLVDGFNDDGIKLVLGPYGSSSTEAAAAVIEKNGQVMVEGAGADDKIFEKGYTQTFAVLSPATQYAASMVKAVAELAQPKPKTVVFLSADDGFSKTVTEGGEAEAKKQGMEVLATESFPEGATDVSAALTKVRGKNADLVLGSVHLEEGIAIIKQSGELGVKPAGGFGETVAPPTPDFVKTLGDSAEGVLGSTQWVPQVKGTDKYFGTASDYAKDYKAKFGQDPEYHNAEATAACLALALGLEKAGSTDTQKVRDAVAGLDEETFFGPIDFSEQGENAAKPMSVIQIQGGKPVTVWPKEQAESELKWPAAG